MKLSTDKNGFLVYKTSKEEVFRAKEIFETNFGSNVTLNSKTVYDRVEARIAGILGEIVYQSIFPSSRKTPNVSFPFDFYHNGKNVDVKCKCRNVPPRDNFDASFFAYQLLGEKFKHVDRYVFMSTTNDFYSVWICGYIDKKDFIDKATFWKKGQIDSTNNKAFDEDMFSVFYSQLNKYEIRKK